VEVCVIHAVHGYFDSLGGHEDSVGREQYARVCLEEIEQTRGGERFGGVGLQIAPGSEAAEKRPAGLDVVQELD